MNRLKFIDTMDVAFKPGENIGFWTKADSQMYFDDLTIKPF